MRLSEIMSSPVEDVDIDGDAAEARARMKSDRIHHLVVRDGGAVVGVVSARDLVRARGTVGEVMTGPAVTASPKTTIREAANLLRGRSIGCLPVVDGKRVVGIVTVSDLLTLLGKGAERPVVRGERWTLKHRGPRRRAAARIAD